MFLSALAETGPAFYYLVPGIVLIPLLGMLINIIIGGRLSEKAVGTIASLASGAAFVISVLLAITVAIAHQGETVFVAPWIHIGELVLDWAFRVDSLSVTMMLVVSGVGTLIHIYAIGYMHEDVRHKGDPSRFRRFFVFLNLFIAMMMILVSADNYLMLFVGWEGVGLSSFLLIGFWYDKGENGIGNAMAAKKAFVTNRVGDFGFLLAIFTMFWAFGSLQFDEVFQNIENVPQGVLFAIGMFMLLGVAGKSAQIPLYVWLPDAMAGPTPVSALIHAATMVTAGVYLIARSSDIFAAAPQAQTVVTLVGASTALLAALIAVGQFDIKRVLAYSTISQLGFMVAAVGMGAIVAGMFHLVTHAFFKALLFLSSGSVIQGVEAGEHHVHHDPHLKKHLKHGHPFDPQDMRNMGGLRTRMKTTFWVYLIGALALAGIPPLAGFWSKDEILHEASILQPIVFVMLIIAAFFTAFYMTRQIIMVFFGKARTLPAEHAHESPPVMTIPLIILAVLSVVGGFINIPGVLTFGHWLEQTIHVEHAAEFHLMETVINAALYTLPALIGIAIGYWMYKVYAPRLQELPAARRPDDPLRKFIGPVFRVFEKKFWVDEGYWALILNPYIALSKFLADRVDWQFWHDWFHDKVIVGGFGLLARVLSVQIDLGVIDRAANVLATGIGGAAGQLRRIQTGFVRNYALAVLLGVVVILGYLIFR